MWVEFFGNNLIPHVTLNIIECIGNIIEARPELTHLTSGPASLLLIYNIEQGFRMSFLLC